MGGSSGRSLGFAFIDRVFVATYFHRDLVCSARKLAREKVFVTSLPLDTAELRRTVGPTSAARDRVVAFPHRNVPEKDPHVLDRVAANLRDATVVRTRDVTTTKADYLKLLASSSVAISSSLHMETFGYSMLEAAAVGSVPVVPDRLCYVEQYPAQFRYSTDAQLVKLVHQYLDNWVDPADAMAETFAKAERSIATMVDLAVNW